MDRWFSVFLILGLPDSTFLFPYMTVRIDLQTKGLLRKHLTKLLKMMLVGVTLSEDNDTEQA